MYYYNTVMNTFMLQWGSKAQTQDFSIKGGRPTRGTYIWLGGLCSGSVGCLGIEPGSLAWLERHGLPN